MGTRLSFIAAVSRSFSGVHLNKKALRMGAWEGVMGVHPKRMWACDKWEGWGDWSATAWGVATRVRDTWGEKWV